MRIRKAVTDPARVHKDDPGHPEICPIFRYHQAFRSQEADKIQEACQMGSMGYTECKRCLFKDLNLMLEPMRERRAMYNRCPDDIEDILKTGTRRAQVLAKETLGEVREAMGLDYSNHNQVN